MRGVREWCPEEDTGSHYTFHFFKLRFPARERIQVFGGLFSGGAPLHSLLIEATALN